jgi:hypothetical protein
MSDGSQNPPATSRIQIGVKVQIIGEPGLYRVALIDTERHTVDLLPVGPGRAQFGVHVSTVRVLG